MVAFELLREAVEGKHARREKIIYAEDRKDLLEQALAVIYPTVAHGLEPEVEELREQHDALVESVVALREHLLNLEEAQELATAPAVGKSVAKEDDDEDEADGADGAGADDADDDEDEAIARRRRPSSIWTNPAKASIELVLVAPGDRLIELVREVRDALALGIREAMLLCQEPGGVIALAADEAEAAELKRRFEAAGGTIEIRATEAAS
jgi:ribosomal protein L7/L12